MTKKVFLALLIFSLMGVLDLCGMERRKSKPHAEGVKKCRKKKPEKDRNKKQRDGRLGIKKNKAYSFCQMTTIGACCLLGFSVGCFMCASNDSISGSNNHDLVHQERAGTPFLGAGCGLAAGTALLFCCQKKKKKID